MSAPVLSAVIGTIGLLLLAVASFMDRVPWLGWALVVLAVVHAVIALGRTQ